MVRRWDMQARAWAGDVTVHARARNVDFFSVIGADKLHCGGSSRSG